MFNSSFAMKPKGYEETKPANQMENFSSLSARSRIFVRSLRKGQLFLCFSLFSLLLFPISGFAEESLIRGQIVDIYEKPVFDPKVLAEVPNSGKPLSRSWASADFNGDGLSDLAFKDSFRKLNIWLSPSSETVRSKKSPALGENETLTGAGDINGDGCADLVTWDHEKYFFRQGLGDCRGEFLFSDPIQLDQSYNPRPVGFDSRESTNETSFLITALSKVYRIHDRRVIPEPRFLPASRLELQHPQLPGVFQDVDGDGHPELIAPLGINRSASWLGIGLPGENKVFAALPFEYDHPIAVPIELNGDGRGDILFAMKLPHQVVWTAAYSNGKTAFEELISLPLPSTIAIESLLAGDFDGDGWMDLIAEELPRARGSSSKIWFARRVAPRGIPEVTLIDDAGNAVAKSDRSGVFAFSPKTGVDTLRPKLDGYSFFPKTFRIVPGKKTFVLSGSNTGPTAPIYARQESLLEPEPGPFVCLSYRPDSAAPYLWRNQINESMQYLKWGGTEFACPDGFAAMALLGTNRNSRNQFVSVQQAKCCRLPASDILTSTSVYAPESCPEDHISTGFLRSGLEDDLPGAIRCTKINTQRYQLGKEVSGSFAGYAYSMRKQKKRIPLSSLPLAFRRGAVRSNWSLLNSQTCVGGTKGEILVSVPGKICRDKKFRALQYRGIGNDPPSGSAVTMFPDCKMLSDIYSPFGGCVRKSSAPIEDLGRQGSKN